MASDEVALECGRLAHAFHALLTAAMGQLIQHYAARLAAIDVCTAAGERTAALAALHAERESALQALRVLIQAQRQQAMREARSRRRVRYRARPAVFPVAPQPGSTPWLRRRRFRCVP
jgi:hypothetical protein